MITAAVAAKRHSARFFLESGDNGKVPPVAPFVTSDDIRQLTTILRYINSTIIPRCRRPLERYCLTAEVAYGLGADGLELGHGSPCARSAVASVKVPVTEREAARLPLAGDECSWELAEYHPPPRLMDTPRNEELQILRAHCLLMRWNSHQTKWRAV
jgi:hypothetical protein